MHLLECRLKLHPVRKVRIDSKESPMKRFLIYLMTVVMLSLLLGACTSQEDPTVAFCAALTELDETGSTIAGLGEVADGAQIVQLGSAMENNWRDLESATKQMDDSVQATFAPYNEQFTAIPAITQETAMPVARTTLDAQNAIATEAYAALYPGNCE
jgi:hypothetical protein